MAKSHGEIQRTFRRSGEGEVVSIQKLPVPMPDGTVALEVGFDLSAVPVPLRRYVAEVAFIAPGEDIVKLCFGQKRVVGDEWRSMIVLNMTPADVEMFLNSCDGFWAAMQSYVKQAAVKPIALESPREEPEQTVAMAANIIAAAMTSKSSCLDCYHLSPFVVKDLQSRTEIQVEPVVRIDCPTALLFSILQGLFQLAPKARA